MAAVGGEVVTEAVEYDIVGADTEGAQCLLPSPRVRARKLRLVDRPGGLEDASHLRVGGQQSAEWGIGLLKGKDVVLGENR
jgi:hypothetical protein